MYCIHGLFGGEFNFADWRISSAIANIKSANIYCYEPIISLPSIHGSQICQINFLPIPLFYGFAKINYQQLNHVYSSW